MRTRTWTAALAASLVLAGCGAPEQVQREDEHESASRATSRASAHSVPPDPVDVQGSPTLAEIRERGTLLVGVRSDSSALVRRTQDGYSGFDVKIARILARGLGLNPSTQVAFRSLPPTLRVDAVQGGSVDLLVGGFDPGKSKLASVGPYVITGAGATETEHYIGFAPGDPALREELRGILAGAARDGSLQRALDSALSGAGVQARLPATSPR